MSNDHKTSAASFDINFTFESEFTEQHKERVCVCERDEGRSFVWQWCHDKK